MKGTRALPAIAAATLLIAYAGGCVPQARPPARPSAPIVAPPRAAPLPPPATDWRDRPVAPGEWRWRRDAQTGQSQATYGEPGRRDALAVACLTPGRVRLFVPAAPLAIRTTSMSRTLGPAQGASTTGPGTIGAMPSFFVDFAANDPLLDAMAFSAGRIGFEFAGEPPITVPDAPELARVVEDCRSPA